MYNFVIFGSKQDLYKISYSEVTACDNVRYIDKPYGDKISILKFLHRLHFSKKVNKFIKLPFKEIWNSWYFDNNFKDKNPICFIFFHNWIEYQKYGLVKYLRGKYPDSKMVCFFQDLIHLQSNLDINHIKKVFDLVLSFDQEECKKYGLVYHQLVFSHYPVKLSPEFQECDVYFLGKAKNRLDEIIKVYEFLRSQDLKCKFYLIGVEKDKQIYTNEIHYIDSMSYMKNLQHVVSSKCLLEIMQKNGHGYTQRVCEAIAYNKKLLTNNVEVKNAPFFNEKLISVFSDSNDIDISFLKDGSDEIADYNFKEQLSPKNLLSFIEEKLDNK